MKEKKKKENSKPEHSPFIPDIPIISLPLSDAQELRQSQRVYADSGLVLTEWHTVWNYLCYFFLAHVVESAYDMT
jgi:hypothetical protein